MPQLLLHGMDYRNPLSDASFSKLLERFDRVEAGADLTLLQRSIDAGVEVELDVRLARIREPTPKTCVAITENRLQNKINAGENQGKRLRHDFVVRELLGPLPGIENGRMRWKSAVALRSGWKRTDLALVAFVQDERSGDILQSLKAPVCKR